MRCAGERSLDWIEGQRLESYRTEAVSAVRLTALLGSNPNQLYNQVTACREGGLSACNGATNRVLSCCGRLALASGGGCLPLTLWRRSTSPSGFGASGVRTASPTRLSKVLASLDSGLARGVGDIRGWCLGRGSGEGCDDHVLGRGPKPLVARGSRCGPCLGRRWLSGSDRTRLQPHQALNNGAETISRHSNPPFPLGIPSIMPYLGNGPRVACHAGGGGVGPAQLLLDAGALLLESGLDKMADGGELRCVWVRLP